MRKIWVVLLVACGDPRAVFVGTYSGTGVRRAGTTTTDPAQITITLTEESGSNRITMGGRCGLAAVPVSATTIQFDPASCPTIQGTSVSGLTADFTDTFSGGTGDLAGSALVLTLDGTEVGSNYSNGQPNETFDFVDSMTLERQ